jgi:type I restriction enzyme S subunit
VLLKDLCNPKQWPTISQQDLTPSGYPVYGANGKIGYYKDYNHEKSTLLITCRGATCGTLNICEPYSYVTGNAMALDALDEKRVDQKFLYYALRLRGLEETITGSAQPQITRQSLSSVAIPLPPLPEQCRIAAILDKADAVRRKRQGSIRLTEEFLRSVFLDMFGDPVTNPKGWGEYPLGDVCDFTAGNSLPAGEPFEGQICGHLLLKVGDMNLAGNEIFISIAREWTGSFRGNMVSPPGSIILPKRGGAISTNKKRMLTRPALLDPNLMGIYPLNGKVNSYYLFQWFQGFDLTQLSSGSAVPQLNKKDLAPLVLAVPSAGQQKKFEGIFRKTHAIKKSFTEEVYSNLYDNLAQRAFRGEL